MVWLGLVVVAIASHAIPDWVESQAKFESHVRGVGMGRDFAETDGILARIFSEQTADDAKNCDSAVEVLHVVVTATHS
jgi:hypothetical protein